MVSAMTTRSRKRKLESAGLRGAAKEARRDAEPLVRALGARRPAPWWPDDFTFLEERSLDRPNKQRRLKNRSEAQLKELARKAGVIRRLTGLPWVKIAKVLGEKSHSQLWTLCNVTYKNV